jgi:hypothetical protein
MAFRTYVKNEMTLMLDYCESITKNPLLNQLLIKDDATFRCLLMESVLELNNVDFMRYYHINCEKLNAEQKIKMDDYHKRKENENTTKNP